MENKSDGGSKYGFRLKSENTLLPYCLYKAKKLSEAAQVFFRFFKKKYK